MNDLFAILSDVAAQVFIITMLEITLAIVIILLVLSKTKNKSFMTQVLKPVLREPEADLPTLIERIQKLESEKEVLRFELWRSKQKPSGTIGYILLLLGTITLALSVLYVSAMLAFIGIAFTFWGALLLFIVPTKYVKAALLDSTSVSSLVSIDQIITALNYQGKGVYLPPRYVKEFRGGKVFIPFGKEVVIPPVEKVAEEKVFIGNPNGMCLTPSGLGLANLFENELGIDFAKVDLDYLQDSLPKLFIEGLELAEDFEMSIEDHRIEVKVKGSIYRDFCSDVSKLSSICSSIGCPLCSSLACVFSRVTGKPIIIEKNNLSSDGRTIEANYKIIEE